MKGYIQHEHITIVNIYVSDNRPSKHRKQKLTDLKGERDSVASIVGGFSIPPQSP